GRSSPGTPGTTTDGDRTAAADSARPGPTTPSPTSPGSGSSVVPSSAASSTNTSEPRRSPGQDRWLSYGTPQPNCAAGRVPSQSVRPARERVIRAQLAVTADSLS